MNTPFRNQSRNPRITRFQSLTVKDSDRSKRENILLSSMRSKRQQAILRNRELKQLGNPQDSRNEHIFVWPIILYQTYPLQTSECSNLKTSIDSNNTLQIIGSLERLRNMLPNYSCNFVASKLIQGGYVNSIIRTLVSTGEPSIRIACLDFFYTFSMFSLS